MLVVIVNYRTGPLVVDCLHSLEAEVRSVESLRVMVVDNASGDASAAVIERAIVERGWSDWAELVQAPRNGGFAYGNNLAIRLALGWPCPPDLIWLLNPDTIVRQGAAQAILQFMGEGNERAGIVGTGIERADGVRWPFAFRFPTILGEIERGARLGVISRLLSSCATARRMPPKPAPADWVSGASMVIRRKLLDEIGLMDEAYFLYFEETDFCLCARRAGWQSWYLPQATVLHMAGQSTGVTGAGSINRRMPAYWFESRRRYFIKNHGRFYAILADLGWAASHMLWLVRGLVTHQPHSDPPRLLEDFLRHSALFSGQGRRVGRTILTPAAGSDNRNR